MLHTSTANNNWQLATGNWQLPTEKWHATALHLKFPFHLLLNFVRCCHEFPLLTACARKAGRIEE